MMKIVFEMRPTVLMSTWCLVLCVGFLSGLFHLSEAKRLRQSANQMNYFKGTKCEKQMPGIVSQCNFHLSVGIPPTRLDCCKKVKDACPPVYCSTPGYAKCRPDRNWCKKYKVPDWNKILFPSKPRYHSNSQSSVDDE